MPNNMQYQLSSYQNKDWAVFQTQNQDPATLVTIVGSQQKEPIVIRENETLDWSLYENDCGAHVYFPSNTTIFWLQNNRPNCIVKVKQINTVNINMRLDINVADFYRNIGISNFIDNMAALLGVHPSQMKVVGVREGSTIIDWYIKNDEDSTSSGTQKIQALEQVEEQIKSKLKSGGKIFEDVDILELDSALEIAVDDEEEGFDHICRFYDYEDVVVVTNSGQDYQMKKEGREFKDQGCVECESQESCF